MWWLFGKGSASKHTAQEKNLLIKTLQMNLYLPILLLKSLSMLGSQFLLPQAPLMRR